MRLRGLLRCQPVANLGDSEVELDAGRDRRYGDADNAQLPRPPGCWLRRGRARPAGTGSPPGTAPTPRACGGCGGTIRWRRRRRRRPYVLAGRGETREKRRERGRLCPGTARERIIAPRPSKGRGAAESSGHAITPARKPRGCGGSRRFLFRSIFSRVADSAGPRCISRHFAPPRPNNYSRT